MRKEGKRMIRKLNNSRIYLMKKEERACWMKAKLENFKVFWLRE